ALSLAGQLEDLRHHNDCLRQVMDRMSFGAVLCDAESRPSWANHTAQEIFSRHEELWLTRGQLATASPADTETLRRSIAQAAREDASARGLRERCLLLGGSMRGPQLQIMVVPLAEEPAGEVHRTHFPAGPRQVLLLFSKQCELQILSPSVV